MASTIADYALIGDCETAALVSRSGSIDWLCWPRFDSPACFAALLGTPANGYWLVRPVASARLRRRYQPHSLILETTFKTGEGQVTVIDFMPARERFPRIIRMVRGERGTVRMRMDLCLRFEYGRLRPSIEASGTQIIAVAKAERLTLSSSVPLQRNDGNVVGAFLVRAGDIVSFQLAGASASRVGHQGSSASVLLKKTKNSWLRWASQLRYRGPKADAVERSLITLKALTHARTGGIVAAPTTSLPETPGGARNWDYRYCWLRDATFTLLGFLHAGYHNEARAWKDWLLRAAGENPGRLRILYDVRGRTIHGEWKVSWLRGFRGATPVRVGNAASGQLQLDIFGELADALYQAGIPKMKKTPVFRLLVKLLDRLEKTWHRPDHGIWEVRGQTRQFTHSKVMCWVAFDRGIRWAEEIGFKAPLGRWRAIRQEIHDSVCKAGFNSRLRSFVQSHGSEKVDASLLLLPLVGFLPPDDPRITGTVSLIEKRLMRRGLVMRHEKKRSRRPEGAFLACSFWLADYYDLAGRRAAAKRLLRRLLRVRNDVGLLAEEYNFSRRRLTGNFPQALSHVALANTIINLHTKAGPSRQRSSAGRRPWML
jgi:GH15 family glucan-1,4-alpha-glucosidase